MSVSVKKHHIRDELCLTRARYREGRQLKAVKVYTINEESQYLLIQGVPALGAKNDLLRIFSQHGVIKEHRVLDEYPAEEFTEVYLIKYERIQSARVAKRKLDDSSFFGGVLHICYAPEYESVEETRNKLQERRWAVSRRLKQLEAERQKREAALTVTSESDLVENSGEHHSEPEVEAGTSVIQQDTYHNTPDSIPPNNGQPLQASHTWPVQYAPVEPGTHHVTPDRNRFPPCPQPYMNQYTYPPPLPLPPMKWFPWQRPPPPPSSRLEHARVPSAHATLPAWMERERYPQQAVQSTKYPTSNKIEQDKPQNSAATSKQKCNYVVKDATSGEKDNSKKPTVVKNYKAKGAIPRFVPHQVNKKKVPPVLTKEQLCQNIKDAVNETLRRNAFILDDVKGPRLPADEEQKRDSFRTSDVGDKSLETTVSNIRDKVKRFSVNLIPRQVKKQKIS